MHCWLGIYHPFGISLSVSLKVKHKLTTELSNSAPRFLPKTNENTSVNVYITIIHNGQKMEAIQMSTNQ